MFIEELTGSVHFFQSDHFTLILPDLTYNDGLESGGAMNLSYPPVSLAEQGYLLVSRQSRTKFYKTNSDMVVLG